MFRKLNFQELTLAPCGASNFVSGVQEFSFRSGVQTMALMLGNERRGSWGDLWGGE